MTENKKNVCLPKRLIASRKLIVNLAKNDFKKKFAGSYFGVVWAFIQPVITVLLYWFVFEFGLHQKVNDLRTGIEVPFVLWLMGGLVPWFYFQEALNGGTGVLDEYSYLVKKVVFQIDALPVVKLISALFTHAFFVVFMLVVFAVMGFYPDLYVLQIVYYSFCMVILTAGLIYATSAVTVFFRDMKEVVAILLQIGMWVTPIMWNFDMIDKYPKLQMLMKVNPVFYIIQTYRDAVFDGPWFWQRPGWTIYFWVLTVVVFVVGAEVFRKLKPHFADVL